MEARKRGLIDQDQGWESLEVSRNICVNMALGVLSPNGNVVS